MTVCVTSSSRRSGPLPGAARERLAALDREVFNLRKRDQELSADALVYGLDTISWKHHHPDGEPMPPERLPLLRQKEAAVTESENKLAAARKKRVEAGENHLKLARRQRSAEIQTSRPEDRMERLLLAVGAHRRLASAERHRHYPLEATVYVMLKEAAELCGLKWPDLLSTFNFIPDEVAVPPLFQDDEFGPLADLVCEQLAGRVVTDGARGFRYLNGAKIGRDEMEAMVQQVLENCELSSARDLTVVGVTRRLKDEVMNQLWPKLRLPGFSEAGSGGPVLGHRGEPVLELTANPPTMPPTGGELRARTVTSTPP